jgi:hypothetical protein
VRDTVTPRVLIFPTYNNGAEFQANELSTANTVFHLLQTLVNARNLENHGIQPTNQLESRTRAYTLM